MKQSANPTEYVLVKAEAQDSDYDSCDFAIIHITDKWCADTQRRMKQVDEKFARDDGFMADLYFDTNLTFYFLSVEHIDNKVRKLLTFAGQKPIFIEVSPKELAQLQTVERLILQHIRMLEDGNIQFCAYHEAAKGEFFTPAFKAFPLIRHKQQEQK